MVENEYKETKSILNQKILNVGYKVFLDSAMKTFYF